MAAQRDPKLQAYVTWKSHVPVLYDLFVNHNLQWPSLSCCWGPKHGEGSSRFQQDVYFCEQTYEGYPNTIIVATCDIMKPRVAVSASLSNFNEGARSLYIRRKKAIVHPGEVNKIRALPQDSRIVATHSDTPEVYIWNLETQPSRPTAGGPKPDLVLVGHSLNAEYALAFSNAAPLVLSGGQDRSVLLWDIEEPLATHNGSGSSQVAFKNKFLGHTAPVEDVQFKPSSCQEFCSVGDDSALIFWDVRSARKPAMKVAKAHNNDVHSVDWNAHEENHVITGSADKTVRMFDRRKLAKEGNGTAVYKFEGHSREVSSVQWCPNKASVFGSSDEEGVVNIWDHSKVAEDSRRKDSGLFFKHIGHRGRVPDFHWDLQEPWLVLSLSQDTQGGGTIQIWRMSDMLYRDEDEVVSELTKTLS